MQAQQKQLSERETKVHVAITVRLSVCVWERGVCVCVEREGGGRERESEV